MATFNSSMDLAKCWKWSMVQMAVSNVMGNNSISDGSGIVDVELGGSAD